jgi:hypothetical protein
LIELKLIFLGGELPVREFYLRRPAALHHALFMKKAIYIIRMELMSERIDLGVEERRHVHQMANFIALFYAKYFLRSRIAVFAPHDDFKFIDNKLL